MIDRGSDPISMQFGDHAGRRVRSTAVCVVLLAAALFPSASWGKRLILGVRHYRVPPPTSTLERPLPARAVGRAAAAPGSRQLAADNPDAYRPRGLRPPHLLDRAGALARVTQLWAGAGFPGLADNGYYPADAQLAVGPEAIVEMTNTMVGAYGRDGSRLAMFPMTSILGNSSDDLTDPQVAWDPQSGRWLAAAMDLTTDSTDVSVSIGADPRGGWWAYSYPYGSQLCPDQPRLGFSGLVIVVAVDLFQGSCHADGDTPSNGGVVVVIDKASLVAGLNVVPASQYGPDSRYDNYVPVQMLSPSLLDYLASADYPDSKYVHVFLLQGVPPNDAINIKDTLLITKLKSPTGAKQRGGGTIDPGDDRINDATWERGVLYIAADDQCTYLHDRYLETCARVMEISTTGLQAKLIGENDIGYPSGNAYYAALRPDANGNLIVVFGYSDRTDYPSVAALAALGPITGEQGGNFTDPIELAGGTSPTVDRWGDYQGAAVDPANPNVIWSVGQVGDDFGSGDNTRWATHIDALSVGSALTLVLPHQVDPGYLYSGFTSQHKRISILPAGGGANVASGRITIALSCRRARDVVTFTLGNEGQQPINSLGQFSVTKRLRANSATLTFTGTFTPSWVSGTASATELSRKLGRCTASGVSFSIHD